jgi:hypothetical protein
MRLLTKPLEQHVTTQLLSTYTSMHTSCRVCPRGLGLVSSIEDTYVGLVSSIEDTYVGLVSSIQDMYGSTYMHTSCRVCVCFM